MSFSGKIKYVTNGKPVEKFFGLRDDLFAFIDELRKELTAEAYKAYITEYRKPTKEEADRYVARFVDPAFQKKERDWYENREANFVVWSWPQ